jgi:hypothetical protein
MGRKLVFLSEVPWLVPVVASYLAGCEVVGLVDLGVVAVGCRSMEWMSR